MFNDLHTLPYPLPTYGDIQSPYCLPGDGRGRCMVCRHQSVMEGTRYDDGHIEGLCCYCGQCYVWA